MQGLEEEMVATIALDVLKGLEYMHAHSMLHRDVKVGIQPPLGVPVTVCGISCLVFSSSICDGVICLSVHGLAVC